MAPLNQVSYCRMYWSNLVLRRYLQKSLSVLSSYSGSYKCWHNQHLESFLRCTDEKDCLRARYCYSAIICQVSGLQTLCYSEGLVLDVCMNPFTYTFKLWWWRCSFGEKEEWPDYNDSPSSIIPFSLLLLFLNARAMPWKRFLNFKTCCFEDLGSVLHDPAATDVCKPPEVFTLWL